MSMSVNVELKFGGKKHKKVASALLARYRESRNKMEVNRQRFEEAEQLYDAYIDATAAAKLKENCTTTEAADLNDSDDYTDVYIPMSYAILLTFHTYAVSTLLARDPVMQYIGRHGEAEHQVQAVETIMEYQMRVGGCLAPLYIWLHDAGKYGVGAIGNYWDSETLTASEVVEEPEMFLGMPIPGKTTRVKRTVQLPGYQGNRLFNIRPRDLCQDPSVSLMNYQKGEFIGYETDISSNSLAVGGLDGKYFNIDYLKKRGPSSDMTITEDRDAFDGDDRAPEARTLETPKGGDVGTFKAFVLYIRLIPKDWELGSGERPEIWRFTMVEEEVLIEATPYGAWHGKFPFFLLPFEFDGYSTFTRGQLEILKPLNDTLSWLVNTHFFNVRSALNNIFIYNPSLIVAKDLRRKGAGRLVRMKESAYGVPIDQAIKQFPVADVTQGHLRDSQIISDMMQRVSGVTDNIMGMVNAGGRKTATEVRSSNTFGINRLKTIMEYWGEVGFKELAQVMLQQTQQWLDVERKYRIAGDTIPGQEPFMEISPEAIVGSYDFVPVDGTLPLDRYAQSNLWKEILMGTAKDPQLGMAYDRRGIFEWMAQLAGLKNIKKFRVQVLPDGMLAGQPGAVPMSQLAQDVGLAERDAARVAEPGQIPGMGATG